MGRGTPGGALEFNGADALVEIAEPQGLNLAGDMTFMAWVKTVSDDARDRLIFGDVAGLAVHRNITIELDRGALHVGHGNDAEYESFSPSLAFDGGWKHLAIVFEQPRYYLYVDGVLYELGRARPAHHAHPGRRPIHRRLGRGLLQGRHRRGPALQPGADRTRDPRPRSTAAPPADQAARISLTPRLKKDTLGFNALFTRLAAPDNARVECELTLKGETQARRVVLRAACGDAAGLRAGRRRGGDSHGEARPGQLPARGHGSRRLGKAARVDREGRRDCRRARLVRLQGGRDRRRAPALHAGRGQRTTPARCCLSVWGRTYRLGELALPQQIVSRDAPLLAAPVRLRAVVGGKEVSWSGAAPTIRQRTPGRVTLEQTASDGPITAKSRCEHRVRRVSANRLAR